MDKKTKKTTKAAPSEKEIAKRVDALLKKMSIEAKIGQLSQLAGADFLPGPKVEETIRKYGAGSVLWLNDTKRFNELQKIAVEESPAGIPILYGLDVIHGYRTIFPQPLAMASSWDPAVPEKAQSVAAREARAAGLHWTFGPMLDIARDARWGRIVEGAGEDPCLGAAMAAAQVRGFQGNDLSDPERVLACAKHFAGYGFADGGRDYDPVFLSESQLRNVVFPPFQAAVKAGVGSFMSAYMDLNNVPASGNRWLLWDVLRKEWGFAGFVVSDAMAVGNLIVQGFARDGRDAAVRGLDAGVNMDMASSTYLENIVALVKDGSLAMSRIDELVRPILALKMRMGLFEHPYTDETLLAKVLARPEHRQASRWAAQRSMVLLRNEGGLLPLSKEQKKVAVIGPLGDSMDAIEGSWMVFGHQPAAVTVLQGLRARLPGAQVEFAPGPEIRRDIPSFFEDMTPGEKKPAQTPEQAQAAFDEAVATARRADLVVAVMGETAEMAGEAASRASFDLPGRQEELLQAVAALGKPVVLVLLNGRPLSINWAAEHIPAILEAWEPGTEGGNAVADLLFGDANPGGKLPVTFPRKASHAPLYYARTLSHQPEDAFMYRSRYWDGPTTPLYPFGFGLSYTAFSYADLKVSAPQVKLGGALSVTVEVSNTGKAAGDEVVQLYIHQKWGRDSRPLRELKGFQRIGLQPGEKKTVTFQLGPDELSYWSTNARGRVQDAADFDVWVGGDSRATLHAGFSVVEKLGKAGKSLPAGPAQTGKYNDDTKLGTILEDERARALLHQYAPEMESNPMLKMAKGM
ncbi:MAG TPA: beta-glucosidase BglX, partial [Anaerolineales bacterium]|nr:beta-glucosidase BglX [Anaerolineales bacterium]